MEAVVDLSVAPPWRHSLKSGVRLNELERAIYSTIAYRDVFDFAPTIDEIHRYLHFIRCTREEVESAANSGALLSGYLVTDGAYFALKHRPQLLSTRRKRQTLTDQLWPVALKYGGYLSNLPHIRMV